MPYLKLPRVVIGYLDDDGNPTELILGRLVRAEAYISELAPSLMGIVHTAHYSFGEPRYVFELEEVTIQKVAPSNAPTTQAPD